MGQCPPPPYANVSAYLSFPHEYFQIGPNWRQKYDQLILFCWHWDWLKSLALERTLLVSAHFHPSCAYTVCIHCVVIISTSGTFLRLTETFIMWQYFGKRDVSEKAEYATEGDTSQYFSKISSKTCRFSFIYPIAHKQVSYLSDQQC